MLSDMKQQRVEATEWEGNKTQHLAFELMDRTLKHKYININLH